MFKDYTEDELAGIKAKYGTPGDVLEAPMMIGLKGVDMMRHCINVVLPECFKAQVLATSRRATVIYREKLLLARDELIGRLKALPMATLDFPEEELEELDRETRFLLKAHPCLPLVRAME